jgi:hypothetical protein
MWFKKINEQKEERRIWKELTTDTERVLRWESWGYVDNDTGQVLCTVLRLGHDATWSVFRRGAGYGEFLEKSQAIKKAEEVA